MRSFARKHLPESMRKPLGTLAFQFYAHVVCPLEGLLFDLSGGRFKVDGCVYRIPRRLTSLGFRASFFEKTYEAEERSLILEFVRPEDTVLELGACIGVVSCVTNKLLRDKSRHIVVEGNPFCIPYLHQNRALNQAGFLIENCAVSNQPEATFFLHPVYIVGGTTQRQSNRPVRIPGRSLTDLSNRYGPFSTVIMDIEGAELETFEASLDVLRRCRLVIVELHDWAIGEQGVARCRELLKDAGLEMAR